MSTPAWLAQNPQPLPPTTTIESESTDPPAGGSSNDPVTLSSACSTIISPVEVEPSDAVSSDALPSTTDSGTPTSVTVSAAHPTVVPTPRGILINTNNPSQDPVRAQFASSPGYVVPAPSFSYSVFPRVNPAAGGAQQSSSSPSLKLTPPMPAAALQPPVPGQFLGSRPFSYNIVSNANVASATGQQFQLTTVPSQAHFYGGKFASATSALSLQPPVPRQPLRPNAFIPGNVAPNAPASLQAAPSASKGDVRGTMNYQIVGSSQPTTVEASQKTSSFEKATSDSVVVVSSSAPAGSVSLQSTQLSPSKTLSSSTSCSANPNTHSPKMLMPMAPSFTARPAIAGITGTHGISNSAAISTAASSTSASITPISSSTPVTPSPTSILTASASAPVTVQVPVPQNIQHQSYLHYPSQPTTVQPPQAFWSSPQAGSIHRAPFSPHPCGVPASYPFPMHGMPLPTIPLANIQPPGVSTGVAEEKLPTNITGSVQSERILDVESLSTIIDQDEKANNLHNDGTDTNSEQKEAWTVHRTETGAVYYYNSITGESTYQRPSNFKGELAQVTAQTTPVSWEKLAGTDWTLVTTNDGKKYYYDAKNKISSWNIPTEVLELRKNQETDAMKESATQLQGASVQAEPASTNINAPAVLTGGRDSVTLRTSGAPGSSSALDLIKKKLHEAGSPVTSSPLATSGPATSDMNGSRVVEHAVKGQQASNKDKLKDPNNEGNVSDSSSDSEDEESVPSKEECIVQFKEMLKEHGVAPFSKWEKELPKIVFDPRFKAVPSHSARRALFEHYVRTRAEEERKEKRAAQRAAIDSFKQLLDEASEDINHKTDYYTFKRKWGSDLRFEALDRKDRELLLNERVKAAEEKIRESRMIAATIFKSLLRENQDITTSSRWSRVKDNLRNDPRYKAVKHEDRETLFMEYISELKAAEDQAIRAVKAKNDEQEKLKEREREMRKRKEREEQELERVKIKVRRKEAEYSFRALLVEAIKDPKASWTESKPKLEKDPLGRATNPDLTQEDAEKLFREHVKDLYERCANDFRALLTEVLTEEAAATTKDGKTVLNSWSEAKRLLKPDPRYSKMPSKDREILWRRFNEDMIRKQKLASEHKSDTDSKSRSLLHDLPRKSPRRSHGLR